VVVAAQRSGRLKKQRIWIRFSLELRRRLLRHNKKLRKLFVMTL
jgi:hypothetical protein